MVLEAVVWAWDRFRPREGWLTLLLVAATVGCLVAAVNEVGWVPEAGVVITAATLSFLLSLLLARSAVPTWRAWLYLTLYGMLVNIVVLARLRPSWALLREGWAATSAYWRQQSALFVERIGGWLATVQAGQSSDETIVFAFFLGLAAWFLVAYVVWSIFRQQRPMVGLTLLGLAMALNGFYGNAPIYWSAIFIGLAVLTAAATHYANLETNWQRKKVDYSTEIRAELLLYAGTAGMALVALSWAVPAIDISRLSETFSQQPAVVAAEEAISRAFAAIPQPRGRFGRGGSAVAGQRGTLPRSFLLDEGPELLETVVMTATVSCSADSSRGIEGCQPALPGYHWRAGSYDIYTGRGWSLSPERSEEVGAGEMIGDQLAEETEEQESGGAGEIVEQEVQWVFDQREIRYSLGYPLRFDQPVVAAWRGPGDFSRVWGQPDTPMTYTIETIVPRATAAQLRQSRLEDIPPALLARYTALPDTIPQRVHDLAQELATRHLPRATPYDQARAIEQFLRQYDYNLDVERPPPDVDVVDYFLFDAQEGYCDYYASAMVVLARSAGLPARMGTGFLQQPPDENGVQIIRQVNGHSWAEIYFAGYGWIEFEPTAPFISPHDITATSADFEILPGTYENPFTPSDTSADPPPIPNRAPQRDIPWWWVLLAVAVLALLWWRWGRGWWREWRERPRDLDSIEQVYWRLQNVASGLGYPPSPSQTPNEFATSLLMHMETIGSDEAELVPLQRPLTRLATLFATHQYAPESTTPDGEVTRPDGEVTRPDGEANRLDGEAYRLWQQVSRPLWVARLRHLLVARFGKSRISIGARP